MTITPPFQGVLVLELVLIDCDWAHRGLPSRSQRFRRTVPLFWKTSSRTDGTSYHGPRRTSARSWLGKCPRRQAHGFDVNRTLERVLSTHGHRWSSQSNQPKFHPGRVTPSLIERSHRIGTCADRCVNYANDLSVGHGNNGNLIAVLNAKVDRLAILRLRDR